MNNVRLLGIAVITAVAVNFLLIAILGIELDMGKTMARLIAIGVSVPLLFCNSKITEVVRESRILRYIFRTK